MPELTDDERTILEIAAHGESMMPIGRWEQPVEHLVQLGMLERLDKFNNVITMKGQTALEEVQNGVDDAAARALIAVHNNRVEYQQSGDKVAEQLVDMVRKASAVTGDLPAESLRKCLEALRVRALELLIG